MTLPTRSNFPVLSEGAAEREVSALPRAYLRVSNISGKVRGVFEANPDGSAPDVELQTERLVPLFL